MEDGHGINAQKAQSFVEHLEKIFQLHDKWEDEALLEEILQENEEIRLTTVAVKK